MRKSNRSRPPRNDVKPKSFPVKGGLNLIDSPIYIPPGMALSAVNYELLSRSGIRRIDGFERYDGRGAPSDETYWVLYFENGTDEITAGENILGVTSTALSKVFVDAFVLSGSYVGNDAAGYIVLNADPINAFINGEDLSFSGGAITGVKATADGTQISRGAPTQALDDTYMQGVIEAQRTIITEPGDASKPVLGINVFKGDVYAFKDDSTGTKTEIFKQNTTTGWIQVFGASGNVNYVDFTLGTAEFLEGETLTQTGTTSTIHRVVVLSGDWSTNDAAGYIVIGAITSGPYAAGVATSASGSATLSAAETEVVIQPSGRFEFENYNFYGTTGSEAMYFVNGVDTAYEMAGSIPIPIFTGNTNDTPTHLAINEYHLMLTFEKGSLQNSATGIPLLWSGGGAAEIGTGDELIGLKKEVGSALAVICRNRTFALFGKNTVANPWDLRTVSDESGGIEWTIQRLAATRYLDDRGFTNLAAVQEYGDFNSAIYSQLIEPLVNEKKNLVISSVIVKSKNQLRTFFSDGTGIIATFDGKKLTGFTTINYKNGNNDQIAVNCTANGEDTNGNEVLFFGSDDGFVYQMDSGTSFDGGQVDAELELAYTDLGNPSYDKQLKKTVLELSGLNTPFKGASSISLDLDFTYDYGSGKAPVSITITDSLSSGDVARIEESIRGVGRNLSMKVTSAHTYENPHTLHSVTYHYKYRKLVR